MRVITWNVAGRVARQAEQAEVLAAVAADVVALQEVTARTEPLWRESLARAGFLACEVSPAPAERKRALQVLVAAREALGPLPLPAGVPWPESVLCCLVGDGEVLTFAHDSAGRLREERGERWNAAERALVHGLRQLGRADVFRSLHGYGDRSASWTFAVGRHGATRRPSPRRANQRCP